MRPGPLWIPPPHLGSGPGPAFHQRLLIQQVPSLSTLPGPVSTRGAEMTSTNVTIMTECGLASVPIVRGQVPGSGVKKIFRVDLV